MIHDTYFPLGREKKDIFHDRILVESGDFIYDSTSQGIPIYIPPNVLKNAHIPKRLPFQIYHNGKEVGEVKNVRWDGKALRGDIHVYPKHNEEVIRELLNGNHGLSVRFSSIDEDFKTYTLIKDMTLEHLALVPAPASPTAKIV